MARQTDIRLRRSAVSGSVPTTSNLNLGELALNTADGKVYMKKSVGGTDTIVEVGSGSGIAASFTAYEYTATSNQTTFSGADNNSNTLAYNTGTPPAVQVFMNGILLDEGSSQDYTGTNGTSIVLNSGADAGDLIQIHAYKSDVSIVSNLSFTDNQKLQFGDSQDLQIFHDGNNSRITDTGTGSLILRGANSVEIEDVSGENMLVANSNGAVELYHNNVKKFETTASGVQIQGSIAATTAAYLPIIYGGSSSLQLKSNTGELFAQFTNNGAAQLYHDNVKKFETTSTGVDVSGNLDASGTVFFNSDLRANNVSNKLIVKATSSTTELHAAGSTGIIFKDSGNGQTASLDNAGNLLLNGLLSAEDNIYLTDAGTARAKLLLNSSDRDNVELRAESIGSTMKFFTAATEALELDASQKASFKGSIVLNSNGKVVEIADAAIQWYSYPDSAYKQAKFRATDYQFKNGGNTAVMTVSSGGNLTTSGVITANGVSGSSFYGITLTRSSSGTTTPDLWGSSGTLVIGTSSSNAVLGMSGTAATFYGTLASGAFTSSGAIVGSTVQATGNLFGTNGLHTLNTAGNGWDHTINRNGGSPTANLPGGITSGNITTTGYLRGPSTFTIDPAAHGDDTGTVVIAGNLQVDGTTTTINSTTLTVDDKNIVLASGSADKSYANGAGITVDCGSDTDATIIYTSAIDEWDFNKSIDINGGTGTGVKIHSGGALVGAKSGGDTQLLYWGGSVVYYGRSNLGGSVTGHEFRVGGTTKLNVNSSGNTIASGTVSVLGGELFLGTADSSSGHINAFENMSFNIDSDNDDTNRFFEWNVNGNSGSGTELMRLTEDGKLGIGTSSPAGKLHISGNSDVSDEDCMLIIDDVDGSAGSRIPAIMFRSNTGGTVTNQGRIRGTDTQGMVISGSSALGNDLVVQAGKVGIGTSSPLDLLHIKSTSTDARQIIDSHTGYDAELKFAENGTVKYTIGHDAASDNFVIGTTNVDTQQRLVINSAGNVGVGVTSIPSWANLMTDGTVAVGGTLYMKTGNSIQALSAFPGAADDLKMQTGGGKVTIGGPGGSTTGHLELYGRYSGSDPKLSFRSDHPTAGNTTVWDMARITADDGGNYNGVLHFQVAAGNGSANNGAPLATAMTIQDNKYVGIGTTSPDGELHVLGTGGGNGDIYVERPSGAKIHLQAQSANAKIGTSSNHNLGFNTNSTTRATIDTNGRFGIGVIPGYKLHISGATNDNDLVIQNSTHGGSLRLQANTNFMGMFTTSSKPLYFGTNNDADQMVLDTDGQLGIGTTNPDTNLEVDIKNGADGNGIHITSTSTTNDPTLKLTRNGGSADRFQFMIRGSAGGARLGISAGSNLDSGLNLGNNNGVSIGTITAAGSGGLLVDNDIKSNSRFGVGSGGSLSDAAIYKNSDTNTGIYWPGTDQIALTTAGSNRLHIASNGGVSLNSQSQLTTGGNARLSIIDSSVQLSMGASNNDMSYIRKQGAGQFAWQTYNSGNSGMLQLQPYGGNVTINTTAAVSGHALSVSGKIGGLTYSDSYVQFTGGNAILKANDDVVIGYVSSLYVKQSGKVGVGTSDPKAEFQVDHAGIDAYAVNTSATSAAQVDTFSATDFRSARFTVQITNTTDSTYQITEILLIHDGTTPSMTEYSTIFTGSAREASFDADIVSGNVRLLATPASTDTMQFKVVRHSILV